FFDNFSEGIRRSVPDKAVYVFGCRRQADQIKVCSAQQGPLVSRRCRLQTLFLQLREDKGVYRSADPTRLLDRWDCRPSGALERPPSGLGDLLDGGVPERSLFNPFAQDL